MKFLSNFALFVAAGVTSGLIVWLLTERRIEKETNACACGNKALGSIRLPTISRVR